MKVSMYKFDIMVMFEIKTITIEILCIVNSR